MLVNRLVWVVCGNDTGSNLDVCVYDMCADSDAGYILVRVLDMMVQ